MGISERTMSKKLNEQTEFTLEEMEKVRKAFPSCSMDYLFTRYKQKE